MCLKLYRVKIQDEFDMCLQLYRVKIQDEFYYLNVGSKTYLSCCTI